MGRLHIEEIAHYGMHGGGLFLKSIEEHEMRIEKPLNALRKLLLLEIEEKANAILITFSS